MTAVTKYKGWLIQLNAETGYYDLYTPWELENPPGFRETEFEAGNIEQAKRFIDAY